MFEDLPPPYTPLRYSLRGVLCVCVAFQYGSDLSLVDVAVLALRPTHNLLQRRLCDRCSALLLGFLEQVPQTSGSQANVKLS